MQKAARRSSRSCVSAIAARSCYALLGSWATGSPELTCKTPGWSTTTQRNCKESMELSYGRLAVPEPSAARPTAPEQNGSAPQSGCHLAQRTSRCKLLSAPHGATNGNERVRPASSWHGSTEGRFVGWNVAQRQAPSFYFSLLKATRPVQNWQLWAAAAAVFAALTALLIKLGVQGVDAGMATLFRALAVAIVLALVLLASGRLDWQELTQLPAPSLGALVLSALATGVSWFCYNRALQLGPVAGVAALDKLSVVLIALLALVFLGEQLDLKAWLGVVLMAVGAALVAWI